MTSTHQPSLRSVWTDTVVTVTTCGRDGSCADQAGALVFGQRGYGARRSGNARLCVTAATLPDGLNTTHSEHCEAAVALAQNVGMICTFVLTPRYLAQQYDI